MRLPMTIISGYLGAGKTTLINRLLAEKHGLKLLVVVNDFGSVNIDAALIQQAGGDQIALTNGCVCCTMGDDLAFTLFQIAQRPNLPDHVIVEASGISDPAAIADVARSVDGLGYGGIVTLVDGDHIEAHLDDALVAPGVTQQIQAADLVLVSKRTGDLTPIMNRLEDIGARQTTAIPEGELADLVLGGIALPVRARPTGHVAYVTWKHQSNKLLDRRSLGEKLANRPAGLYRMKGFVLTNGGAYELHVVGGSVDAKRTDASETSLVALGLKDRISAEEIERWWSA